MIKTRLRGYFSHATVYIYTPRLFHHGRFFPLVNRTTTRTRTQDSEHTFYAF